MELSDKVERPTPRRGGDPEGIKACSWVIGVFAPMVKMLVFAKCVLKACAMPNVYVKNVTSVSEKNYLSTT